MSDFRGGRWKLIYLSVIALVVVVAGGVALWRAKWGTYHFATVDAGVLYRDGNRGEREFCHALERGKIGLWSIWWMIRSCLTGRNPSWRTSWDGVRHAG